jgi:hypothetical protein
MLKVDEEATLADIDEAIAHMNAELKKDHYGNRMTWQKKQLLQTSIDDLLEIRFALTKR